VVSFYLLNVVPLQFIPLLPVGLGFAAGAMFWVAICELLMEAIEKTSILTVASASVAAFAVMFTAQNIVKGSV
jgi:zinc transporter ZupT